MGDATPSGLAPDGGAVLSLPPPPTGEAVKSLAALERPKAAELRCLVGTLSAATLSAGSGASICVAPARPPGRWPIALRAATGSLTAGEAIADGGHLQYADREVAGGVAIPEAVSAGVTSSITVAVPGVPQWRASAHLDCRVEAPGGVSAVTAANGNVCSLPAMSAGFGALTLASQVRLVSSCQIASATFDYLRCVRLLFVDILKKILGKPKAKVESFVFGAVELTFSRLDTMPHNRRTPAQVRTAFART